MFMRGNIDHLEQPEEYHKMPVPGKLKFLWNIKLKFLNENTTIRLPTNTLTPTLSAVASEYLYPYPVSRAFVLAYSRKTLHKSSNTFIEHARQIARI